MRIHHRPAMTVCGAVWLIVGVVLLYKGIHLVGATMPLACASQQPVLLHTLHAQLGSYEQAALILIVFGLFLGWIKGKTVMRKSAEKSCARIRKLPPPLPLTQMYSFGNICILIGMMGCGILLRWASIPQDIHGAIDVAVGAALIHGSTSYFKAATAKS